MKIDLLTHPVLTKKSYFLKKQNSQYTFDVFLKLTKLQIKTLIQDKFKVNVICVNTHCPPRKKKVLGTSRGYRPGYKRVIVTLNLKNKLVQKKKIDNKFKLNT